MILLMFALLLVFVMMGIPVSFAMGVTSLVTILILGLDTVLPSLIQVMNYQATSFTLLAIPFFILAGTLMNSGGLTERIFGFARNAIGFLPGGLGHVNVFASMIFAGMSGSAVADAAGLGKIEIKAMTDAGFDTKFSAGITAASATIGPVIPPSIPFVVYGAITGLSVNKLFLGGVVPGVVMGLSLMIAVFFISLKRRYPRDPFPNIKKVAVSFIKAIPAMMTPVIVVGCMVGGFFTPTEASIIASVYALIIGITLGGLRIQRLPAILLETIEETVKVLFIVVMSAIFGWLLVYLRGPDLLVNMITSFTTDPRIVMLLIIALLFILGCFMESIAIILTIVPMIAPLAARLGIDPIHLGVTVVLTIMIGLVTPPVGMTLFAVSAVTKMPPEDIYGEIMPYLAALIGVVLLIAFVPQITLFVPNLL